MKLTRVLAIGTIAASLGIGAVSAQSINGNEIPAEFPPANFSGKQFVDSRGCVYIRAGIDGATTWVPRVTRDRKVICGFKPTFDSATTSTSAAPKIGKDVVQIQPAAPETASAPAATTAPKVVTTAPVNTPTPVKKAAPAATVAAPATTVTTQPKAAPKKAKGTPLFTTRTAVPPKPATTAAPTVIAPAQPAATPNVVTTTPTRRTKTQQPRAAGIVSPCREGVNTWKGSSVRCGPQALSPVTPGTGRPTAQPPKMRFDQNSSLRRPPQGTVVSRSEIAPDVRVVPRHVWENNLNSLVNAPIPEGYRRAFDDGRLDDNRAVMTMAGQSQMEMIWTNTVPRKLVPVTALDPRAAQQPAVRRSTASGATVSTKSEPASKSLRLSGTPYVQVGSFGDAASAQAAAKQIKRLGLPVRIGKYQKNGVTQRMVLAGPFDGGQSANAALAKAQAAGFGSAFVRQ